MNQVLHANNEGSDKRDSDDSFSGSSDSEMRPPDENSNVMPTAVTSKCVRGTATSTIRVNI